MVHFPFRMVFSVLRPGGDQGTSFYLTSCLLVRPAGFTLPLAPHHSYHINGTAHLPHRARTNGLRSLSLNYSSSHHTRCWPPLHWIIINDMHSIITCSPAMPATLTGTKENTTVRPTTHRLMRPTNGGSRHSIKQLESCWRIFHPQSNPVQYLPPSRPPHPEDSLAGSPAVNKVQARVRPYLLTQEQNQQHLEISTTGVKQYQ